MVSRRNVVGGLVAACMAPAVLADEPINIRSLNLKCIATWESLHVTYWINGHYVDEAVSTLSYLLRDWREESVHPIATAVLDVLSATHRLLDTDEPFYVSSGYRTPKTNAMLRSHDSRVSRGSFHTRGMAVDVTMKSRTVQQIGAAALSLHAGGVGQYADERLTHIDCGPVRRWDN